jgi:hypothetical protein
MRTRSILTLASVAIILIVAGIGNALAYTYPGIPLQSMDRGYDAVWTNTASLQPNIYRGETVGWYNQYYNAAGAPDTAYLNYGTSPYSGELSLSTYPVSIPAGESRTPGFWGPTAGNTGVTTISANHAYEGYGSPRSTSTWTGLKFNEQ